MFQGQRTPISQCPRNGRFESKIPVSLQDSIRKMGFFSLKAPISGAIPVLLFVGFLDSLVNLKRGISLVILRFSLSFPRILWVQQGKKILGNFEVFLDKNQGKEGQGWEMGVF